MNYHEALTHCEVRSMHIAHYYYFWVTYGLCDASLSHLSSHFKEDLSEGAAMTINSNLLTTVFIASSRFLSRLSSRIVK